MVSDRGPSLILGTAGHIDHGKTALCRALTGVDTDRLPEEKRRGITLELGFAPLDLPDGTRLGVVDVPGHEGLVRTMVAGAAGIDLLLLVVAADEGVMPQTREHLAIAGLLGIERGLVALTKVDSVSEDMLELATDEVRELLAPTRLATAALLPVSAQTGQGLDALREALMGLAAETPPRTPRGGPPRLPIDRAFEMRGFGAVVTGTLLGGALRAGDPVVLLPGSQTGRVRGLQSHGASVEEAQPGTRCAVNLQGVPLEAVARGQVLTIPGALEASHSLDARVHWLAESPALEEPSPVSFLSGTRECLARIAVIGAERLEPGEDGFARLHLEGDGAALLPGDAFVLRGFARGALGATLGGGRVLDIRPPHKRRSDPGLLADLEQLARREPGGDVEVRVRRAGLTGIEVSALGRETGLVPEALAAAIDAAKTGELLRIGSRIVSQSAVERLEQRLRETVASYHLAEPLRPGMPAGALRGTLPENVPAAVAERALEALTERGELVREGEHVRSREHRPELDAADQATCDALLSILAEAGLEAPAFKDLAGRVDSDATRLRDLLAHLERQGRIVSAPSDLWFDAAAVEALRQRVRAHFEASDSLDTPTYKTLIGTTRRTAVPLMELLDAQKFTLRRGEARRPGRAYSQR